MNFIELNQSEKKIFINPQQIVDVEIYHGRVTITFPQGKTLVIPASSPEAEKVLSVVRAAAPAYSATKKSAGFKERLPKSSSPIIRNLLESDGEEKALQNPRQLKAEELAAAGKVEKRLDKYFVEETLEDGSLVESMVFRDAAKKTLCNCDDFKNLTRGVNPKFECEHILAVRIFAKGGGADAEKTAAEN